MLNTFKDKIYLVPEDWEKKDEYESLYKLRNKVIIKSKGKVENIYKQGDIDNLSNEEEDEDDSFQNDV